MEARPCRVGNRAQREDERDEREHEWRKSCGRRAMQRALVMLMLALRGSSRAVRVVHADFEGGCRRTGRELRDDRAGQHGVEHERIGGDPADQPAPKSKFRSSLPNHDTLSGCARISLRIAQDTVQKIIA